MWVLYYNKYWKNSDTTRWATENHWPFFFSSFLLLFFLFFFFFLFSSFFFYWILSSLSSQKKKEQENTWRKPYASTLVYYVCVQMHLTSFQWKEKERTQLRAFLFLFFLVWGLMTFGVFHLRKASWFLTHMMWLSLWHFAEEKAALLHLLRNAAKNYTDSPHSNLCRGNWAGTILVPCLFACRLMADELLFPPSPPRSSVVDNGLRACRSAYDFPCPSGEAASFQDIWEKKLVQIRFLCRKQTRKHFNSIKRKGG